MSAPNSAYLTEKLPLQDVGVAKYDNLLALKLSEYGSNIKSLFYLDALLVAKENGGTKEGFCGMVLVGSNNAAMHNMARWGKGRTSPDGGATKYIILNDGGLNTLGYASNLDVIDTVFFALKFSYDYLMAYYVNGSYGAEFSVWDDLSANWGAWTAYPAGTMSAGVSSTEEITIPFALTESIRTHGVRLRGYVTNDEGTFYTPASAAVFLTGKEVYLREDFWTSPPVLFYMNTENLVPATGGGGADPTRLFSNEEMTIPFELPRKFYYAEGEFITYGYYAPTDYYAVLTLESDPPGPDPTPVPFEYRGFNKFSQSAAEDEVIFNTGTHIGTLYENPLTSTMHKSYSGTYPDFVFGSLADPGYYADGNTAFVTAVIKVENDGTFESLDPINT